MFSGQYEVSATTGKTGRYALHALFRGSYQVQFSIGCGAAGNYAQQWWHDQPSQSAASLVTVAPGKTTKAISATLHPLGTIEGTVRTTAEAAVSGECVTAVPFHPHVDPFAEVAWPPAIAMTRASGRYRLLDLPPGQYKIEFSAGCGNSGFTTQWWDNATSARSASVISVGFRTIRGIDATLRR
jgi:hypothetical protein